MLGLGHGVIEETGKEEEVGQSVWPVYLLHRSALSQLRCFPCWMICFSARCPCRVLPEASSLGSLVRANPSWSSRWVCITREASCEL